MDRAKTFDLLLFKTNTAGAKLVRGFTQSDFGKCPIQSSADPLIVVDHIAMIITIENKIHLLEASGGQGVEITPFSEKKRFIGNYYRKMVHRELTWNDASS